MRTTLSGATLATLTALAVLLGAATASAAQAASQKAVDSNWRHLLGCWQLLDERVSDESDVSAEEVAGGAATRRSRANTGTRVCVEPAGSPSAVLLTTLVGGKPALEETVTADGADHPMVDNECKGTKRSDWSTLAPRLFTRAEITCGDQAPRKVSSLTMLTGGPTWVDIQLIEVGMRKSIRVRRFARTDPEKQVSAVPFPGESRWTVADVKEASAKLTPETVQAALVELGQGFDLNGKKLVELDNAGVADSVIDLMVALSYPDKFVVDRPSSSPTYYGGGMGGGLSGMWPWIADEAFWPSYYSPFAYRYWGYYDPYHVPGSGYVVIPNPGPGGGGDTGPVASGTGRVVNGQGYTQIRNREAEPVRGDFGGGNNSTFSNGGGGSSGGGNSGVSSGGGYSSGGGGGGGDRTAVARPPG